MNALTESDIYREQLTTWYLYTLVPSVLVFLARINTKQTQFPYRYI